jgi:hypothetical protein
LKRARRPFATPGEIAREARTTLLSTEDARAERARIVAWLRRGGAAPLFDTYEHAVFEKLADAIARGAHRK